ncbi:1,4-dihydroxy-2-naphthoate octaprenyltransferase [uncultured Porphyromonas sp.]|uniref:1,4-dihydroxy-2-naphthoate octaprenyltransferase n=1 Tax=uncultured Porphyromonas sp. TaxID=159274 RepID=UPI0025F79944|nr:1,4-dihydroxy-2-naphthoate octaprenyltransferase [uncultured Porphyromonas sp.]
MSNRLSTWVYATRPHTLGASIAPMLVVLGALIAEGVFDFLPYLCAILVALSAQITSNFANDYFDYKGEKDTDKRVGFRRVLVTGEVTPREMLTAMLISTGITILSGIVAVLLTGAWWLIAVGLLVLVGVYAYSYGPYPLSTHGLGDVAVVLFYGMTPILATYGAIGGTPPLYLLLMSVGIGIWEDNILVCNNYRDYAEDRESGKRTIIVRMGEHFGPTMYLLNSLLTVILLAIGIRLATERWGLTAIVLSIAPLVAVLTVCIYRWHGSELNKLLKYTNLVSLVMGLLLLILQVL